LYPMDKLERDLCFPHAAETVKGYTRTDTVAKQSLPQLGELMAAAHELRVGRADSADRFAPLGALVRFTYL
jgi:hypothetical protein